MNAQQLFESKPWRAAQNAAWHAAGVARNLTVSEMWNRAVRQSGPAFELHEHQCATHYFAHAKCDCAEKQS